MKTPPHHSEVWVIDQGQARLYRHRQGQWQEELSVPYPEFAGSAVALSSFSMPDTQVYLNVSPCTGSSADPDRDQWVGLATDPPRLIKAESQSLHQQMIGDLKKLGQKVTVICVQNPRHFAQATPLSLLNGQEISHLQRKLGAGIALWLGLWLQPSLHYQRLRLATLLALAAGFLLASHFNRSHQKTFERTVTQQAEVALRKNHEYTASLSLEAWAEQIRKFGQGNRANLQTLKVTWGPHGEVSSQATVVRDRKRFPKGCQAESATSARCSTGAGTP